MGITNLEKEPEWQSGHLGFIFVVFPPLPWNLQMQFVLKSYNCRHESRRV